MPSASLTSVRVKPVFGLLAVTVAPGVAAPSGSSTRPEMLPVVCCANPDALVSSHPIAAPTRVLRIRASGVQERYAIDARTDSVVRIAQNTLQLTPFDSAVEPF